MAFCVGRWVAAIRLTATVRPRRAIESACRTAPGASSTSSAYSSMRMMSAGIPGAGSQTRWPCSASSAARASRTATALARSAQASPGLVASRSRQEIHGPSSMPFLRSMPHRTTSRQADRLPISTLRPPLAHAGRPAEQDVAAKERDPARDRVLERAQLDGLGDRGDRRAGPRDRVGVRVGVEHAQLAPVGVIVRRRVHADGTPEGAETRFDGGYFRDHVVDGLAPGQPEPGAPAPKVHHRPT